MSRPFSGRFGPFVLAALVAACGGTADNSSSTPTGPSPVPSPSPSGCSARVTDLPPSVPSDEGRYVFTVTIASGCAWTARTDASWADIAPGGGQGTATPVLRVAANTRFDARTLTVTVNDQSFRTIQNAFGCSYTVEPTSLDESPNGGSAAIALVTVPGCSWTATASEGWIRVLTPSGTGSATIRLDLDPNPSDVRHAFVTIGGQRVNVNQRRRGS